MHGVGAERRPETVVDLTHKWRLDLPSQEYFPRQVLSRLDGGREDDDRSRKDDRLDGTG